MDSFIGTILIWPANYAPQDWVFCDGRDLPIQQYAALYSVIGTIYGGNGQTTFKVPDLRGRLPFGAGAANFPAGGAAHPLPQAGGTTNPTVIATGSTSVVITQANLPAVSPSVTVTAGTLAATTTLKASKSTTGVTAAAEKSYLASTGTQGPTAAGIYLADTGSAPTDLVSLSGAETKITGAPTATVAPLGNGTPAVGNVQVNVPVTSPPFLSLNFIICVNGIYPPRN